MGLSIPEVRDSNPPAGVEGIQAVVERQLAIQNHHHKRPRAWVGPVSAEVSAVPESGRVMQSAIKVLARTYGCAINTCE